KWYSPSSHSHVGPEISNLDSVTRHFAGADRCNASIRRQIFCPTSGRESDCAASLGNGPAARRNAHRSIDNYHATGAITFSSPNPNANREIDSDRARTRAGAALFEIRN